MFEKIIEKFVIILGVVNKCLLQILGYFIIKNNSIWIFGEGNGELFVNNSMYLFLHVLEKHKNIHPIWFTKRMKIVKKVNELGGEAYLFNSFKALFYGLIGKLYIHSFGRDDIINYSKKNAIFVNLYHGMVIKKLNQYNRKDDLDIASSKCTMEVRKKMFPNMKKLVITGEPRYDIFHKKINKIEIYKQHQFEEFANKKIISYLPTFRAWRKNYRPIFSDFHRITELDNAVIFERSHPREYFGTKKINSNFKNIFDISDLDIDTNRVLAITDILITDYSSCFVDFLLTERPIIFYIYDYEEYSEKQGFFYDYEEVTPGIKVYTEDQLFEAIKMYMTNPELDKKRRIKIKKKFHKYDDGKSAERVYHEIINLL